MAEPILIIKDLQKAFTTRKGSSGSLSIIKAVDFADLSIYKRESLGLVGESGSGKSTLARLILKLYPSDGGKIYLDNQDITRLSQRQFRAHRQKVQMVFQDPHSSLDPRFRVRKILKEAMGLQEKRLSRRQRIDLMIDMLRRVGLSEDAFLRFPHEFSGGERQRIAIARALIMNPQLLILDEAVSSLDVLIQMQIIELLEKLQKELGLTYLFITHNLRIVRRLCHRIAVMYGGRIVEVAPTEELFNQPMHPYTRKLLMAAIKYKASQEDGEKYFTKDSRLIDKGNEHFVLE
ncbi:MAG: ATP-binding cassette domain-containing protein [Candidatus Omnitrophota bacterium]